MGQGRADKGFDLPLPLGVGLTYSYIHQNMVVSDLIVEGRPINGLTFKDAPTTTHTGVFRADVWVFPFLNIYGLVGETSGITQPVVVFPNGEVVKSDVNYNRLSYGGGLTLAGGYKAFFLTIDANYTTGPIVSTKKGQIGDKPIESFTLAPRLGMLISSGGRMGTGSIWIGGMCLKATSEIHDSIDLTESPGAFQSPRSRGSEFFHSRSAEGSVESGAGRELAIQQTLVGHGGVGWRFRSVPCHHRGDVALLTLVPRLRLSFQVGGELLS